MKNIGPNEQLAILSFIKEITGGQAIFIVIGDEIYHGPTNQMIKQIILSEGINPKEDVIQSFLKMAIEGIKRAKPIPSDQENQNAIPSPYFLKE